MITLVAVSQGSVQRCPFGPIMILGALSLRYWRAYLSLLDHGTDRLMKKLKTCSFMFDFLLGFLGLPC